MSGQILAIFFVITCLVLGQKSIIQLVDAEVHSYQQPNHHLRHTGSHHHHQNHPHGGARGGGGGGGHGHIISSSERQQNENENHKLTPNLWTILDKGSRLLKPGGSLPSDKTSDVAVEALNRNLTVNGDNNNNSNVVVVTSDTTNSVENNAAINGGIKCPKCSGSTNVRVSEEELIELRIEFVKNQILQKLRLKERPQISGGHLPKPIFEGTTLHNDEKSLSKDLDDYYARTSQKFIFLDQAEDYCHHKEDIPSICFSFKIDGDVDGNDVNTAELWVYKKESRNDIMKQTLVVAEVERGFNDKYLPKAKPMAIQSTGVEEGWIKFDIAWPIRKWFNNHDLEHGIQISCESCEMDITEDLISMEKDYRPFIVIDTQNSRKRRRQKRSVNCTAGATECCREKLYISFEEIGWGDWIIQPPGYNAYFCRGSCSSAASITMSGTHHSSFLRKVIYQKEKSGGKALELIPCCTAKKYSSLQLFYRDSNNTATLKTLPNMVVESCGCM